MRSCAAALALLLASAATRPAEARSFRVNDIPNGGARSCQTCHETFGGIVFNAFGSDVRSHLVGEGTVSSRHVDWAALAARDSDGDGFTNGQELGDPDGVWRIGEPSPGGSPSDPGDPESLPSAGACGDGKLAPSETCDGAELRDATCESLHLGVGTVVCGADCRLDTSDCDGSAPADDEEPDAAAPDQGGCAMRPPAGPAWPLGALTIALTALVVRARRARD